MNSTNISALRAVLNHVQLILGAICVGLLVYRLSGDTASAVFAGTAVFWLFASLL